MLCEPTSTPYDLKFGLGRTHIRVHPLFWVVSIVLGWNWMAFREIKEDSVLVSLIGPSVHLPAGTNYGGIPYLAMYMACIFVSIILHEFGHVWMGRFFGSDGNIVLYSFGGLAVGSNNLRYRWERVAVSLAGPGIQLLLFGSMWLLQSYVMRRQMADWPIMVQIGWFMLLEVNFIWPLFNLLPIWPLDGGMVTREVCEGLNPRNGTRISLAVSTLMAGFMVLNTFVAMNGEPIVPYLHGSGMWGIMILGSFAVESYMLWKQLGETPRFDDRLPWER